MDDCGFAEWYREERPRLYATLAAICGDRDVASDAVDEALARAYERWERVGSMASPGGWTYHTALNVARRRGRRRLFEQRILTKLSVRRLPPDDPADGQRVDVVRALQALPVRMRQVVALHYVGDLSTRTVAEICGISEGTVVSTLHAARRRLADDTTVGRDEPGQRKGLSASPATPAPHVAARPARRKSP